MPVLIDINSPDHHLVRGEENPRARAPSEFAASTACITIGLVNNMPDSALIATERQLFELLNAAAGNLPVRLRFYTLPLVPRSEWGQQYMRRFYSNIGDLLDCKLDGLIVTGAEPQAPNLAEEPYWGSLGQVIDWARENTVSAVWSCLAVHGAVLHLDGIDRRQLGEKCIGVFDQTKMLDHPLMHGVPSQLRIPHSRWNDVSGDSLALTGHNILTKSADAGVDLFVKQQKSSLFVYFQGHPEYEAQSLLGEYRRDVGRFFRQEIESYPTMPKGYFDEGAEELLADFRKRALSNRRNELFASFPVGRVAANLKNTWHSAAIRIYRNWILYISGSATRRVKLSSAAMTRGSVPSQ
jgi:homoserine O-succinyltransferase